jgi:hypothetical protein
MLMGFGLPELQRWEFPVTRINKCMRRVARRLSSLRMWATCIGGLLVCFAASLAVGAPEELVYFPLASGMEWIMDLRVISQKGDTTNGVLHRKIGEPVECGGQTYFRSHTWLEGDRPFHMDYTKLVRRDAVGFYSIDERDPKRVEKQGGKLPLEVGKKWENKVEGGILQTTVLAKEDVSLGTNVYKNCFRIRITAEGSQYVEEFLEAPGVGSLKSESNRADGKWVLTLREFKKP